MASEDYATEGQIKRLYAVLHSIGIDPKQWKKDKNIASYAKLTRAQCSAFIDDAEAIEAQQKGSYRGTGTGDATTDEEEAALAVEQQKKDRLAAEVQRIREEQGRPEIEQPTPILTPEATPATKPKPTVPELIEKYFDILVQVTQKVKVSEEISEREKGYATNWLCDAVKDAMQTGGDREE